MKPKWWNKAKKQLRQRDKVMKKLLSAYKGHLTTRNNFFYSLTRSIISQQISVSAADSVFSKFEKKCRGKINPKTISKLSITNLDKDGFFMVPLYFSPFLLYFWVLCVFAADVRSKLCNHILFMVPFWVFRCSVHF